MTQKNTDHALLFIIILAMLVFSPMFIINHVGRFDFWWWMTSNLLLLTGISAILFKDYIPGMLKDFSTGFIKKFLWGIISAVVLYLVFLAGNYFSNLLFSTAESEISGIYAFKGDASRLRIFLLMLLVIGPGEELFWRGFLQDRLMRRFKPIYGFIIATTLYTLVHVLTGNFMLIMAALVAGLFWGWMYYRFKSIAANIISHIVWDITIFLILPISQGGSL